MGAGEMHRELGSPTMQGVLCLVEACVWSKFGRPHTVMMLQGCNFKFEILVDRIPDRGDMLVPQSSQT